MNNFTIEDGVEIRFGGKVQTFVVRCYDGYAVAIPESDEDFLLTLSYPPRDVVVSSDELSSKVLRYRGLYDLTRDDITYGDIMFALGTPKKIIKGESVEEI